jgi:hypothetical protein
MKYRNDDAYDRIESHIGHSLEAVSYASGENVAVECEECGSVVFDYDRPEGQTLDDLEALARDCEVTTEELGRHITLMAEDEAVSLSRAPVKEQLAWLLEHGSPGGVRSLLALISGERKVGGT